MEQNLDDTTNEPIIGGGRRHARRLQDTMFELRTLDGGEVTLRENRLRTRIQTRTNEFLTKVTVEDEQIVEERSTFNRYAKKVAPYLMEFVGTTLFLFAIGCVVAQSSTFGSLAIGSALMCLVFLGGHVSGAHYNPAVTLGIFLSWRGMLTIEKTLLYMTVQLTGSVIGSFFAYAVTGVTFAPEVGSGYTQGSGLLAEFLATFFLVSVVLNVATTISQDNNHFFGLAIGFTVFTMAVSIGSISGGAINPAVGTGPSLVRLIISGQGNSSAWIYWVGPLLGSVFAALVFRVTSVAEYTGNQFFVVSKLCDWKFGVDGKTTYEEQL